MTAGPASQVVEAWRRRQQRRRLTWREAEYLVVDFETTGLDVERCAPLSVGWAPVRDGSVLLEGAGYSTIRYRGAPPTSSMLVHRLVPEDLRDAPPPEEVASRLRGLLEGRVLVAHIAGFERRLLARLGVEVPRAETVDTVDLARSVDRLAGGASPPPVELSWLATRLGLPVHRRHHAFGDVLTTAGIFLALAVACERHGFGSLDDLLRLGGAGWRRGLASPF